MKEKTKAREMVFVLQEDLLDRRIGTLLERGMLKMLGIRVLLLVRSLEGTLKMFWQGWIYKQLVSRLRLNKCLMVGTTLLVLKMFRLTSWLECRVLCSIWVRMPSL